MIQTRTSAMSSAHGRRLRRLPFVLALTLGLLLSLIHCAGDGFAFAAGGEAAITTNDHGAAPDLPDQLLPAHSGHCLSHVTAQAASAVALLAPPQPRAPAFAGDHSPRSLAGLPLFKPPRA